mmetsp:Transcript_60499/g.109016  ORF Transcript_60499/g.109016 Transcript_60499/m.109016 type:complete len:108 (-) Transcript_60499:29-352(-)
MGDTCAHGLSSNLNSNSNAMRQLPQDTASQQPTASQLPPPHIPNPQPELSAQLVPGGVLIVAANGVTLPPAAEAFAGLLSPTELLLVGMSDLRERWLQLCEPILAAA